MTSAAFKNTLEEILDVPRGTLKDEDSRETIPSWSSLADVKIVTVISGELGIDADGELLTAETVGDLIEAVRAHGVFID
jgi:acyl carrier protein